MVTKCDHLANLKYSYKLPYAFTEHGALMVASVLNTKRAVEMSVFVVRAFVKLRRAIANYRDLAQRFAQLEKWLTEHDKEIISIVQAIKELMSPTEVPKKRRIGFHRMDS